MRSVLVKYRTDVFNKSREQKQKSDILPVRTEQVRSISTLLYGFTHIELISAKVENDGIACSFVVISYSISLPTSLYQATVSFLIVHNTFSLHILSKFIVFIRHKQGFLKFPPERTIREISDRLWANQLGGYPHSNCSLPQPCNKFRLLTHTLFLFSRFHFTILLTKLFLKTCACQQPCNQKLQLWVLIQEAWKEAH